MARRKSSNRGRPVPGVEYRLTGERSISSGATWEEARVERQEYDKTYEAAYEQRGFGGREPEEGGF